MCWCQDFKTYFNACKTYLNVCKTYLIILKEITIDHSGTDCVAGARLEMCDDGVAMPLLVPQRACGTGRWFEWLSGGLDHVGVSTVKVSAQTMDVMSLA